MLFTNLDFIFLQLGSGCVSNYSGCSRKNGNYSAMKNPTKFELTPKTVNYGLPDIL